MFFHSLEPVPLLLHPKISISLRTPNFQRIHGDFASMFSKSVYGTTFKEINFVPLQSATFCVQCELISTNHRPYCLACGNTSLLSLSRVLGGSVRQQQTAHLITDSELDSLVRDLLCTVPDPRLLNREVLSRETSSREIVDVADHH